MKEFMRAALQLAETDYCEIRLEDTEVLTITFQGRGLDRISEETVYGGNARALYKGGWGFCSFNSLGDLSEAILGACAQARFVGEKQCGVSRLASVPKVEEEFRPVYTLDPRGVSLDEKIRILTNYMKIILGFHSEIAAADITYSERLTSLHFANTEDTYIEQEKTNIGSSMAATARRASLTISKGIGRGSSIGFDCVLNADEDLKRACDLAVRLLDSPQVKAGVYTVICDPGMSGLFIHEAFGHLSEADAIYRNPALTRAMTLGRRLGRDILTVYDSGEYADRKGFLKYDDEGVEATRAYLIKDGLLAGRLHSRETAGVMGEKPTGSARAVDYRFPPLVRMRNTCIAPGTSSFDDMIRDVPLGLYVVGSSGGETSGDTFSFMAGHGYMIRNGRLAELVRDVKLMGNVADTLQNIDMVGCDAEGRDGAGGCGKAGQWPMPTSEVCPTIRIRNVIVGGVK